MIVYATYYLFRWTENICCGFQQNRGRLAFVKCFQCLHVKEIWIILLLGFERLVYLYSWNN